MGELETGRERFAVHVDLGPSDGKIIGAGPITGSINAVRIKHDGQVVTEVPQGDNFDVEVDVSAQNPGATSWAICATMITTGGQLPNYDVTRHYTGPTINVTMKLDEMGQPGPMPANDITLRIRLFGNQDAASTPPPQSEW